VTKAGRTTAQTLSRAALLGAIGVAVACGSTPTPAPTPSVAGPSPSCVVAGTGGALAESLSVSTPFAVVTAHATEPTKDRFVVAQVYETLIRVDCEGRVYAGLAESWTTDATKTRLTLTLSRGARFGSGEPILSRDVVASWRAAGHSLADAATIVDDRTLIVSLPDTSWTVLADPALVIHRPGSPWPEGSGPYRVVEPAAVLTLSSSTSRIVIRSRTGTDARDAIDAGADLVLAADPQAVRYAVSRSDLTSIPLPWSRTYALVGRNASADWGLLAGDSAATFRASLARDAVRAEARGAVPSGWWSDLVGCAFRDLSAVPSRSVDGRGPPRVVYRADDQVARALAERLVAVRRGAIAAPLSPTDFARALHGGTEAGYIVSLPRESLSRCQDVVALRTSAPWLGTGGPIAESLLPLVDTRERAILNRARVSVVIDWDGTLRMITRRP
jgi:hypothetical protein